MTTDLDKADYLADNIAILYKDSLRAEGSSVGLKLTYGNGYALELPEGADDDLSIFVPVEREVSHHQTLYRVSNSASTAELVEHLG